jgi:hypothetical protein
MALVSKGCWLPSLPLYLAYPGARLSALWHECLGANASAARRLPQPNVQEIDAMPCVQWLPFALPDRSTPTRRQRRRLGTFASFARAGNFTNPSTLLRPGNHAAGRPPGRQVITRQLFMSRTKRKKIADLLKNTYLFSEYSSLIIVI